MVITPELLIAKIPSPLPALMSTLVGVDSVIATVMTVAPTAAFSATEAVCPGVITIEVESATDTV